MTESKDVKKKLTGRHAKITPCAKTFSMIALATRPLPSL